VRRIGSLVAIPLLLLATGCGTSSSPRELQSILLTPSPAENGVQFVATGNYNQAPLTVSPLTVFWEIPLLLGKSGPTITQNGLATCTAGAPGTFNVLALAPQNPNIPVTSPPQPVPNVGAETFLTCP
jgi:hypothetical protein